MRGTANPNRHIITLTHKELDMLHQVVAQAATINAHYYELGMTEEEHANYERFKKAFQYMLISLKTDAAEL